MKKVISFSLFGLPHSRTNWYYTYLPALIRGYISLFPGWELWFYHDANFYGCYYASVMLKLQGAGLVRLIYTQENPVLCKAMLWRLKPIWEPEVEYVLCRDIDHTPTGRERLVVDEFVRSGLILHSINDNESHTGLMGGLIGFKAQEAKFYMGLTFEAFREKMGYSDGQWAQSGTDQVLMNTHLWPVLKGRACVHSSRTGDPHRGVGHVFPIEFPVGVGIEGVSFELMKGTVDFCNFIGTPPPRRNEYILFCSKLGPKDKIMQIEKAEEEANVPILEVSWLKSEDHSKNKRKVILSCTQNDTYLFFLPIVSLVWQRKMGFCPVVFLIGSVKEWMEQERYRLAIEETVKTGAVVHFVASDREFYEDKTLAQIVRLYAFLLSGTEGGFSDTTYMILADVDMLMLNRGWINQRDQTKQVNLFFANAYGGEKYPLNYVGMNVGIWKQVMGLPGGDIGKEVKAQLSAGLGRVAGQFKESEHSTKAWLYDEVLFTERIKIWSGYPEQCQMINREGCPPNDRIDRENWSFGGTILGKADAHLVRPGYENDNWQKIHPVLRCILNDEEFSWVCRYREKYATLKG